MVEGKGRLAAMGDMSQYDYRMPPEAIRRNRARAALLSAAAVLVTLCVLAGGYLLWRNFGQEPGITALPVPDAPYIPRIPKVPPARAAEPTEPLYPVGKLIVTEERRAYASGDMILSIPRLNLSVPVQDLPDPDADGEDAVNRLLNNGPGLFFCAQMPGEGNANVSIAGHRDIYGCEFYYLDTITEGDLFYLDWRGRRYVYEYYGTTITTPDDWTPVMVRDFPALTLQTCTPIGIASHRMFVTGKLLSVEDVLTGGDPS